MTIEIYEKEMKKLGVDLNSHCYNHNNDTCDGSCQGACECSLAKYYRGEIEIKPTKEELMEEFIMNEIVRKEFNTLAYEILGIEL